MLPYNVLNYAFGLTAISLRDYCVGSIIGMLPGTVLFVVIGAAARGAVLGGAPRISPGWDRLMLGASIAATVVVTVYLARVARVALGQAPSESVPSHYSVEESEIAAGRLSSK